MRYLSFLVLVFIPWVVGAEKLDVIAIRPGEVIYAKFNAAGAALRLVSISKEKTEGAQLTLTMEPFDKSVGTILKVESKFEKDMRYKAEMRWPSTKKRQQTSVIPVKAGLMAFESWPYLIEEIVLYGFELEP